MTPPQADGFAGVADLGARETLRELRQVDFHKYPELRPTYDRMLELTRSLLIPEDGNRPIRLVLVDDMSVNAAFVPTTKGDRVLLVNLGLLAFVKNDDELAQVLGHELEHGLSELNAKFDSEYAGTVEKGNWKKAIQLKLLDRMAESEVDMKSVFRRVHKKGFSPYAARDLLIRLREMFGDPLSPSHNKTGTRINAVEGELTGMARGLGERLEESRKNEIVNPALNAIFKSKEFRQKRLAEIGSFVNLYGASAEELFSAIAKLGNTPSEDRKNAKREIQKKLEALRARYADEADHVEALLRGVVSEEELLDVQLRHRAAYLKAMQAAEAWHFGPGRRKVRNLAQYEMLKELGGSTQDRLTSLMGSDWERPLVQTVDDIWELKNEMDMGLEGVDTAEARSRLVVVRKELAELEAKKRLLLSGYTHPDQAEVQAERAAVHYLGRGHGQSEEYRQEVRELDRLQRHAGEGLRATEAMAQELDSVNADLALAELRDHSADAAFETFKALPLAEQKRRLPGILDHLARHLQEELAAAPTDELKSQALYGALKFFDYDRAGGLRSLIELCEERPNEVSKPLEKMMGLAIEHGNIHVLEHYFPEPMDRSDGRPFMSGFGLKINEEIFHRLGLGEISLAILNKRAELVLAKLRARHDIDDLAPIFKELDKQFDLLTQQVKAGMQPRSAYDRPDVQSWFHGALTYVHDHLRPDIRAKMSQAPGLNIFALRYPEIAHKALEDAPAAVSRIDAAMNQVAQDPELVRFINGTVDFDSYFHLHEIAGSVDEATTTFLREPQLFENYRWPVLDSLDAYREFHIRRRKLLSDTWERGVRGPGLRAALAAQGHYSHSDLIGVSGRELPFRDLEDRLKVEYFSRRGLELIKANVSGKGTASEYAKAFKQLFEEFSTWNGRTLQALMRSLRLDLRQQIDFLKGASDARLALGNADKGDGSGRLQDIGHLFGWTFGTDPELERFAGLDTAGKIELFQLVSQTRSPEPFRDHLFNDIWEHTQSDPVARKAFLDEAIVGQLYYDHSKRTLALWQLDQKYHLDAIEAGLKSGRVRAPEVRQERALVRSLQRTLNQQFPESSNVKDTVLNRVEEKIRTSQAESRVLSSSRINLGNWAEVPELIYADLPEFLSDAMGSSHDRKELIEYLIGRRKEIPSFVHRVDDHRRSEAVTAIKDLGHRFVTAHPVARVAILQPLLDHEKGILSEPEMATEIYKLILGKHWEKPVIRRIFEAYLESVPEAQQKVILSHVLASFVDAPTGMQSASLKTILEALGPFGIKAGQFLHTSGLLGPENSKELRDFLDNALPPDRVRAVDDFEEGFGRELRGLISIEERAGSGSINYVQKARMKLKNGREIEVGVRIRRPYIEGQVANEDEIWGKTIAKLRVSGASEDQIEAAEIIEETRAQAVHTLREGGPELDPRIERANEPLAREAYSRELDRGPLKGFKVAVGHVIEEAQNLIPEKYQGRFSVYEWVPHTKLEDIPDVALRQAIAEEIVQSELQALFQKGMYDPDGHSGNWLIDLHGKRIVRIDYAQLREAKPGEREAFQTVFAELTRPRPDFGNEEGARSLARLLVVDGKGAELSANAIRNASKKVKWGELEGPQERLFALRRAIQTELGGEGSGVRIRLGDMLRSGFASLGKISEYKEILGPRFTELVAGYAGIPKMALSLLEWKARLKAWGKPRAVAVSPTVASGESREVPPGLEVVAEHGVPSETRQRASASASKAEPVASAGESAAAGAAEGYHRLSVELKPKEPGDPVLRIGKEVYDSLPDGAEVYARGTKSPWIKSVDSPSIDDLMYGNVYVLASDYNSHGGPKVHAIRKGPPRGLDLSHNPYTTGFNGMRVLLLTPEQYEHLPEGTLLFDAHGARYLKGAREPPLTPKEGHLTVGFPDRRQHGFEEVGAEGCHVLTAFDRALGGPH